PFKLALLVAEEEVGLAAGHVEGGNVEIDPAVAIHVTPGRPVAPDVRSVGKEAGRVAGVGEDEGVSSGLGGFGGLFPRENEQADEHGNRGRGGARGAVHGQSLSVRPPFFLASPSDLTARWDQRLSPQRGRGR